MAIREPGGITPKGDKENERVKGISNVSKSVNAMQRNVESELQKTEKAITNSKDIQEIQSSMNGVLRKLNDTIGALSKGVTHVTTSTARATKDAISQYGAAISQDISINKRNLVASALAQSTPIFGYFAAKFMETDVFKKAASRMREQVGKAFSGIANIFRKGRAAKEEKIPHMQHGGYVEKGGLAELHPAEVVMPIDEVLARIDESMSVTRQLAIATRKAQLSALGNMSTFVQMSERKQRVGIMKGFLRAYSEVNTQYLEPDSKRMLRALLAIQDAIGAQIGTWEQVWQKMLIEHPAFRNIIFLGKTFSKVYTIPRNALATATKERGGYKRILSQSSNPLRATAETLGAFAVENLWFQEQITTYTKASAQATMDLAGALLQKKYPALPGISKGFWSLLGFGRTMLNTLTKWGTPLAMAISAGIMEGPSGVKSGWKTGKGLGEWLTKERQLKLPDWMIGHESAVERRLGKSFEGEDLEGGLPGLGIKFAKKIEPYLLPYYKFGSRVQTFLYDKLPDQYKLEQKQVKLLEYTKEANEESLKIQKRRGIIRWITMLFPIVSSLFSNFVSMITSPIKALKDLLKGSGLLAAMASGPALAKFLGPSAGVLGAAAMGYGIGTAIEKYFLKPMRDKLFEERLEEKAKGKEEWKELNEARKQARARVLEGKGTEKDYFTMRVGKQMKWFEEMEKERSQYIRGNFAERMFGDKDVMAIVNNAQLGYMFDNYNEYLKYPQEEIIRLRQEFFDKYHGMGLDYAKQPRIAGMKREQRFLQYLREHGTPRYSEMYDPTTMERVGIEVRDVGTKIGRGYEAAKATVTEAAMATVDKTKMVATEVQKDFSKVEISSKNIAKNMNEGIDKMVQVGKEGVGAVVNVSNTAVSNMSNSVATSMDRGKRAFGEAKDDLTERILNGRVQ